MHAPQAVASSFPGLQLGRNRTAGAAPMVNNSGPTFVTAGAPPKAGALASGAAGTDRAARVLLAGTAAAGLAMLLA